MFGKRFGQALLVLINLAEAGFIKTLSPCLLKTIGIWILQPRINKLIAPDDSMVVPKQEI